MDLATENEQSDVDLIPNDNIDNPPQEKVINVEFVDENGIVTETRVANENEYIQLLVRILSSEVDGRMIYACYTKTKKLTKSQRGKIARLVAKYSYEKWGKKVSTEQFLGLAEAITMCFVCEAVGTYYIPYSQTKKTLASGKLWYAFNAYKKELKKLQITNATPNLESESVDIAIVIHENDTSDNNSDLQDDLLFLKNNVEPWDKIELIWDKSFDYQRTFMKKTTTTIQNYLDEFAAVKYPLKGYLLLKKDFKRLHNRDSNVFVKCWPDLRAKLLELVFELDFSKTCKNAAIVASNLKYLEPEYQVVPLLYLLTYVVPALYVSVRGEKRKRRPTHLEIQESFYFHIVNPAELDNKVNEKRADCKKEGYTFQPLLIFVGPLDRIESSYILVCDVLYRCTSAVEAIELCFAAFWSLDASYPIEANQIWVLFQNIVYNITDERDKLTTKLHSLIKQLHIPPASTEE